MKRTAMQKARRDIGLRLWELRAKSLMRVSSVPRRGVSTRQIYASVITFLSRPRLIGERWEEERIVFVSNLLGRRQLLNADPPRPKVAAFRPPVVIAHPRGE